MTYEHRPGSGPASPDVDMGIPEICEKCNRDCPERCEAFKRLVFITNYLDELEDTGRFIDKQKIIKILKGEG